MIRGEWVAGCGNAQNRGCEEAVGTDLPAESLFLFTEGTLSSRRRSSPEVVLETPELWGGGFEAKANFGPTALLLT